MLDDSRAQFFRREPSGTLTEAAPEVRALGGDGQSATRQSRRAERDRIVRDAVAVTKAACDRSECDQIVVIAPERMLGAFRKQAPDKVRARLWRERAGEVGAMSANDIAQSVEAYFREGPS